MDKGSEDFQKLLESLGFKNGHPILSQLAEEEQNRENEINRESDKELEEDWYDSLNSDDADLLKDYGTTPPRTERNRKQRERNAYCTHAVAAAKMFTKTSHKLASRCASLPISPLNSSGNVTFDNYSHMLNMFRQRKRSQDIQRSYERQIKFRVNDWPNDLTNECVSAFEDEESYFRCDSLPPVPLAIKVPLCSRYMSLSSKKIGHRKDSGGSPRIYPIAEIPPDRVAFYSKISTLLKNSQEQIQGKSKSEEEVLYQQELSEMVWLELQAWHAGKDTLAYDAYLLEQRAKVKNVYDEVMTFNFSNCSKTEAPCLEFHWSDDDCSGCLSVWCDKCRDRESLALQKVWQLLEKIEKAESLFPSTRKLCQYIAPWKQEDFIVRYKALCLWFNATCQLRWVIDLLGRRLGHMTNDCIPWPTFSLLHFDTKHEDKHCNAKDDIFEPNGLTELNNKASKKLDAPIVRFEISELEDAEESSDPSHSTESDLTSGSSSSCLNWHTKMSENDGDSPRNNHLSPPPSSGLKRCTSDIFLDANPYRTYVEKLLRNKGMKKTLDKVAEVIRDVMQRTICIIDESHAVFEKVASEPQNLFPSPLSALQEELNRHTKWTSHFSSLGLPHFHSLFLFLACVPLHMMMECLKLRLQQMPVKPSRMSIKQLMREYKEGVKFAVIIRQKYLKWCAILLPDLPSILAANLESRKTQAIEELDCNIKKMIEVYLEWLDQFILMLHREPYAAGLQRNFLQEEWKFVQATCPHVTDGECLAATRFCNIACHMLCSVRDFLDTGLDDMIYDFQAATLEEPGNCSEENSNEIEGNAEVDDSDIYCIGGVYSMYRRKLVERCRSLQELITEARERALRAVALAKMLKKDLEVAVEIRTLPNAEKLFHILITMNHVLIEGHGIQNLLIFVPEHLDNCAEEILSLLQMRMSSASDADIYDFYPHKYLILVNRSSDLGVEWQGRTFNLALNAESAIALSRIQVCGLMLIVKDGSCMQEVRGNLNNQLRKEFVYSSEQIAPHKAVTHSLYDMKTEALQLCKGLEKSISDMEEIVSMAHLLRNADEDCGQLAHLTRDTVHHGFIFGFEYHREVIRLVSGRQRSELSPMLISFARLWMKFVKAHYSPGKGRRPRWAHPGFEFLLVVCDPYNTNCLSDPDFHTLKNEVEDIKKFIIGCESNSDSSAPSTPLIINKTFRSQTSANSIVSHQSPVSERASPVFADSPKLRRASTLTKSNQPSIDRGDEMDSGSGKERPIERLRMQICKLEHRLDDQQRKDTLIGKVCDHHKELIEIKPHSVSFSWHRGFKIGGGRFGKVYTAVNNNSGELMAMKVLPLQPNDHKSIKRVINELKIFEKIEHPNLVKYYGVEIHNDEMMMFMEYCDEGTLGALAARTEGLPEEIVRKYTRQLLSAVHTLHEKGIVHRDIKGANIFLALEGNILKLGDFGSAQRLQSFQTEVGELSAIVGTHAYMAPEIYGSTEGYGRAADIWSLGCVVIEMVTGKRPWPQYDSGTQIMYQVCSGHSPPIPSPRKEFLSEDKEGNDFLGLCFIHDPKKRATSATLLDHTFVKVEDEENASLPLFSLLPLQPLRKCLSSGSE